MAIPVNIDQLINQQVVESNRIEFKADYNRFKDYPCPVLYSGTSKEKCQSETKLRYCYRK